METKPSYSMSLPKPMALKIEEQSEERIENNLKMGMEERIAEEIEYNGEAPVIINQGELLENMREEHNLRFKTGVLMGVQADEGIRVSNFNYFYNLILIKLMFLESHKCYWGQRG